jgi:hypothetical protein
MRLVAAIVTSIGLVVLAACGSSDDSSSPEPTDASPPVATAATTPSDAVASPTDDGAALALPEDLPVGVPDGGKVENIAEPAAGTLQDKTVVRMSYPDGVFDDVVVFYDEWFADNDIEVESTPGTNRHRWSWTVEIDATPRMQMIVLTTGGSHDLGGSTLNIHYDALD